MGMGPDGGFFDMGGTERRRLRFKIEQLERENRSLVASNARLYKEKKLTNHARAVIDDEPHWDDSDPDKDNFESFLVGKKFFTELDAKKAINWCIKFEKVIKKIALAYYFSFGNHEEDGDWDWYTKLELREISKGGFRFAVYQCIDDQVSLKDRRGDCFLPIDFLWTDWKNRCEDKKAALDAKREVERAEARAKQKAYKAKKEEQRYLQAKKLVERRDREQRE